MLKLFDRQFVKYILVGICNTLFSYGVYSAFLFLGFKFQAANLMALLLGIAFSFTTQGNVVFKNASKVTFVKFVVAWLFIYLLNISIIGALVQATVSPYVAGAVATVPVTLVSYFILKYVVFRRTTPVHEKQ
ncbi:hypothetical protein RF819_11580 [Rhodoferax fermentans]|uniref:GtrA/DPMS transmembrane domain-containing protein n=2 Tax=Rhodoferax fermentans TaxID=28066 RepID=A0A1T1ATE0_RHOFE|nr:hypothetical protein RF819_11580 [Rhodoferax fermentans]